MAKFIEFSMANRIRHQKSQAALRPVRLWPPENLCVATAGQQFPNGSRENSGRRRYMKLSFTTSREELEAIKKNVTGCMSAQCLFSSRFSLCFACAVTMVILTIYSGYSCTRNLNVEKPRDLRSLNRAGPNESRQVNEENASPCLKDVFKDILLVVVYNYPYYDSIPHLVALYKPAFPHILFCGPPHNTTRPGVLTVDIYKGILGYECLGRAIREHPGYKGYFYISDDVILNYWNFPDFDREKIWESSFSFGSTPVYEPASTNWYWWVSPYGLNNCRRACEDVANMNFGPKRLNVKYHLNTLSKNSNGTLRCFSGRSDILYIPQKHAKAFSILSETFYERKVFLEIAVPTMIRFLEREEIIGHLPGYYIPGDVRRGDPRVTDSRFFWFVYFPKNKLWFIHPFKLHQQELDSKFNLIMLKFILIEKVKTLTNCKPKLLNLDRHST